MAKKIILSFNSPPVDGNTFYYGIEINGIDLIYDSGFSDINCEFLPFGSGNENPISIEIQTTLNATIENTLAFLIFNFKSSVVEYSRVNNTIEILIDSESLINVTHGSSGVVTTSVEELSEIVEGEVVPITPDTIGLRYFLRYSNIVNDDYLCKIYKKNFTGTPVEISGFATIEKGSVKEHLDPIRGTGLSLELEASTLVTLEDLYTQDEQDLTVNLYKNNNLVFSGFLKPDGVYQSFVDDIWVLALDCVDGLGSLSNLSFVQDTGFHFIGKMKAIDIIYHCLKRTGIQMPINTSVNILYKGLTASDSLDILDKIKLNADRFIKTDNETIMSCEDVLKSVLDLFTACITQENGEWYIYKPNEIYSTSNVLFRRYDINNVYVGNVAQDLNKVLGSQINNFYPHHCNSDQLIEIKGSISAFRLGYKYGFVKGLLPNPNLQHDSSLVYPNWTVIDPTYLFNNPTKTSGFIIKNTLAGLTSNIVKSDDLAVANGDSLMLKISYITTGRLDGYDIHGRFIKLRIQQGSYYLKYAPKDDKTPLDDASNAIWSTDTSSTYTLWLGGSGTIKVPIPKIESSGTLSIAIIQIYTDKGITTIQGFDVIPNTGNSVIQGEFHTVSRVKKVSSIVKENKSVSNGDNAGMVYIGAIYKDDGTATTSLWNRKNIFESKPLLQIASEEELRISQKPLKIFKGSIYGFMPYLSFIDINNVEGKFMPIDYTYNTKTNVTKVKLLELFSDEIDNIDYKLTYDYGNTVKPTISG